MMLIEQCTTSAGMNNSLITDRDGKKLNFDFPEDWNRQPLVSVEISSPPLVQSSNEEPQVIEIEASDNTWPRTQLASLLKN